MRIKHVLFYQKTTKVKFYYKNDTEAHIAYDATKLVVFFRGTEPDKIKDIHSDIAFSKEDSDRLMKLSIKVAKEQLKKAFEKLKKDEDFNRETKTNTDRG